MREEIPSLMYGKERSRGILYDVKILLVTDILGGGNRFLNPIISLRNVKQDQN